MATSIPSGPSSSPARSPSSISVINWLFTLPFTIASSLFSILILFFYPSASLGIADRSQISATSSAASQKDGDSQSRDVSGTSSPVAGSSRSRSGSLRSRKQSSAPKLPNDTGNSYDEAVKIAKNDLKLLLVYLHAPDHDDTSIFVSHTLGSQSVTNLIQNSFITFTASVRTSQGLQLANSVLDAKIFPFIAVLCVGQRNEVKIVERVQGWVSALTLSKRLEAVINANTPKLRSLLADRNSLNHSREIRSMQDEAYERSLQIDQEKARLKVQQQQEQRAELEIRLLQLKARKDTLTQWIQRVEQEKQTKSAGGGKVRLQLRLLEGERKMVLMKEDDTVRDLYARVLAEDPIVYSEKLERIQTKIDRAFNESTLPVEQIAELRSIFEQPCDTSPSMGSDGFEFTLVVPMPRQVLGDELMEKTLGEIKLSGSAIVVEENDVETDSEEESS